MQSQSQLSQCDNDRDARIHSVNTNTNTITTPTSTVDNFWTGTATNIVTQELAIDGLEENPLYRIPTPVAQQSQTMMLLMTTLGTSSSIADTAARPGSGLESIADNENNNKEEQTKFMSLDGTTLHNLEILL